MQLTFKICVKCFTPYVIYVCTWKNVQQHPLPRPAPEALIFFKTVDMLKIHMIFVVYFPFYWFSNRYLLSLQIFLY